MRYHIEKIRRSRALTAALITAMTGIAAHAQTFITLVNLNSTTGGFPEYETLVQGIDGNLYGTTSAVGPSDLGTVFVVTSQGQLKNLHKFDGTDGSNPVAGLMVAPNGTLYGTTQSGGTSGDGTIFKITPSGTITSLHSFDGTDGANPYDGLVQATNGMLYGTTQSGGATGVGAIFEITPSGTLTSLQSFSGTDGAAPYAGLVQAASGLLYGTTSYGTAYEQGTVYSMSLSGTLKTLCAFDHSNGSEPIGGLVQGTDGNFYGTTNVGEAYDHGIVFKITPTGTLTTLHSFGGSDGAQPEGTLVQGTDGNFYGTTAEGGANCAPYGCGTIFQITPTGTLTTLHSFSGPDGSEPLGGLVQGTDGNFYGVTWIGGSANAGTIFSLSMGLGPFVKTLPAFGRVGSTITILGTDMTGASSVTFNGTAATFTILSPTDIRVAVPSGATGGTVEVVTPGGTLSSNVPFQVLP
jgi:uncharacterized repeat protein (TIGR03803 family)